jgi:hypothetical protein
MNKSELHQLIEHPENIGKSQLHALKTIGADFPYYQGVQVLIAKGLANEKHYEFDKQLKKTALTVPDRSVLFRFIHQEELAATAILVSGMAEVITEPIAPVSVEAINEIVITEQEMTQEQAELMEEMLAEAILETPAVEATIEVEVIEEIPVASVPSETEPENIVIEVATTPEILPADSIPPPEKQPEPIPQREEAAEVHSFMEWLQLSRQPATPASDSNLTKVEKQPEPVEQPKEKNPVVEQKVTLPPAAPVEEEITTTESIQVQPEIKEVNPATNIGEFESILDKFIRENPRITRPKAEFFNPVNKAKQSVEEDEYLVTETLANIYYKQGHLKKAIKAYEKLCLIYPHKMAYFADLIQKIKQELKD